MLRDHKPSSIVSHPLMSWDIAGGFYWDVMALGPKIHDVKKLKSLAIKFGWVDIAWRKELQTSYDALVLTDADQIIDWVNPGFKKMTGYPSAYAIGRSPAFLQGEETSRKSMLQIKKGLDSGSRFEETVTNYRKNGELYQCHLLVIPIQNKNEVTSHYLALETEV